MITRRLIVGVVVLLTATAVSVVLKLWSMPRPVGDRGVFRSGQLSQQALSEVIRVRGVRTVVSLRGRGRGQNWYPAELQACSELGVAHHTISFKVDDWAPRSRILQLVDLLVHADRPVLLHCRRGADRTGLAAAVATLVDGGTLSQAGAQLRLTSGHICLRDHCPQHRFLAAYGNYLDGLSEDSSRDLFLGWIEDSYCPAPFDASLQMLLPIAERLPAGGSVEIAVQALNRGGETWVLTSGPTGVRLGIRAFGPFAVAPDGPVDRWMGERGSGVDLGRAGIENAIIVPGQSRLFRMIARVPEAEGFYIFQIDLVQEHVHWFSEMGWPGLMTTVRVTGVTDELRSE